MTFRRSLVGLAGWVMASCQPFPSRPLVSAIQLSEVGPRSKVVDADVLEGLATTESPRFLWISDRIAVDYEVYDPSVLSRDLERVERYYRSRGYYEAKVTAARVIYREARRVRLEIVVDPGTRIHIASIASRGLSLLPFSAALAAQKTLRPLDVGAPFDEPEFEAEKRALSDSLSDHGFAFAKVEGRARVDLAAHSAHLEFVVEPGKTARYGSVQIVGLESLPEKPIRHALGISVGQPYSRSELAEAEKALLSLGVFSHVELHQDLSQPNSGLVPIRVLVREAKLRALRLGFGLHFDVLRLSSHLRAGWEHKNWFGGLRRLSVETRPGATFFPTRVDRIEVPALILPENNLRLEFKQPDFVEGRTIGFLGGEYNVYPLLYPLPSGVRAEDEPIVGYHEVKAETGVERSFFDQHLFVRPAYNWQANFPFSYQGQRPPGLDEPVRVSFPALLTTLDFRDDPIQPRKGILLSHSFEVAWGLFGGKVSDIRLRPELRTYLPLFRQVTLATRATFGFLFPDNYGESLSLGPDSTTPRAFDPTDPEVIRDQQKLLFRAFYSGGATSNRGYPYQGVGPHGPIGFLVPTGLDCTLDRRGSLQDLPSGCIRPLGGLSLWEASLELRFAFPGPLSFVLFADSSDVTRGVGQIRFTVPHLSVGTGFRYKTPVGPVRLDVGLRVPGLQALGKREISSDEGRTGGDWFGFLPAAAHLAIGEAF